MIRYTPLWATIEERKISTYVFREQYGIPPGTISRLRRNEPVTTQTINHLCMILGCGIEDIVEYVENEKEKSDWLANRRETSNKEKL